MFGQNLALSVFGVAAAIPPAGFCCGPVRAEESVPATGSGSHTARSAAAGGLDTVVLRV